MIDITFQLSPRQYVCSECDCKHLAAAYMLIIIYIPACSLSIIWSCDHQVVTVLVII